jgi:3-hydroxyisobutyrate dehydrogenase-like beta-hydroxyacid dehydrogenase
VSTETVGFVGLGNMGGAIAQRIQSAGYGLVVYDIRAEAAQPFVNNGARLASCPADVARECTTVLSSLPGPVQVEQVALGPGGLIEGIHEGSIYVDLSSSSASLIGRVAESFKAKGASVLDGPLSGGREELLEGKQEVMIGGDAAVLEKVRPILCTFGDQIFHAGSVGAGTVCKLAHNMAMRGLLQIIAESMVLGVKAGVDAETVWEAMRRGLFGKNSTLHRTLPQTSLRGDYDSPSYTLALATKDQLLATAMGRELNVPLPVANLVEQTLVQSMNRGWGGQASSVPFVLQEEAAGVEVRAPHIDQEAAQAYIEIHPEVPFQRPKPA